MLSKLVALGCLALGASAQPANVLNVSVPLRTSAKRGGEMQLRLTLKLQDGYHVNSHKPADEYLIPLRITWNKGPIEAVETVFPEPRLERYAFSPKPVSVFSGVFEVITRFKVAPSAPVGLVAVSGKLRYQACTEKMCLPPRTIDIKAPVEVH